MAGFAAASSMPLAAEMPTRSPVKLPGPVVTAMRSSAPYAISAFFMTREISGISASAWPSRELSPALVDDRRAPDIVWVGRLAVAADESAGEPKPLYLRAPDAQPQDAARLPRR